MCRVLCVSRARYYSWLTREPSARAQEDARLQRDIDNIYARSRGTYGVPRMHAALTTIGWHVSRKRIARLMASSGLSGQP